MCELLGEGMSASTPGLDGWRYDRGTVTNGDYTVAKVDGQTGYRYNPGATCRVKEARDYLMEAKVIDDHFMKEFASTFRNCELRTERTVAEEPLDPLSPAIALSQLNFTTGNARENWPRLLRRCEGDCDDDGDCEPDLTCHQRSRGEVVPGCFGEGVQILDLSTDYCYKPAEREAPGPADTSPGPPVARVVLRCRKLGIAGVPFQEPASIVVRSTAASPQFIDLNDNVIRVLRRANFAWAPNLRKLDLAYNLITRVPPLAFQGCTLLQELDLSFNCIGAIANGAFLSTALESLTLNGNAQLRNLTNTTFRHLPALRTLDLGNNAVVLSPGTRAAPTHVFAGVPALTTLSLPRNEIAVVTRQTFAGLVALLELVLHGNRIAYIAPGSLSHMARLGILKLQYNLLGRGIPGPVYLSHFPVTLVCVGGSCALDDDNDFVASTDVGNKNDDNSGDGGEGGGTPVYHTDFARVLGKVRTLRSMSLGDNEFRVFPRGLVKAAMAQSDLVMVDLKWNRINLTESVARGSTGPVCSSTGPNTLGRLPFCVDLRHNCDGADTAGIAPCALYSVPGAACEEGSTGSAHMHKFPVGIHSDTSLWPALLQSCLNMPPIQRTLERTVCALGEAGSAPGSGTNVPPRNAGVPNATAAPPSRLC